MSKRALPTIEEMEKQIKQAFPVENAMCQYLCDDWNDAWTELGELNAKDPKDPDIKKLMARINALLRTMKSLRCPPCIAR
jgi:hypothetical protein